MSKMISVAAGFQYSVNIGYDIYDDKKLQSFIPTKASLKLLEEILDSTGIDATNRARVLIGAYGKGKSHIVLAILSVLMKKDFSLFQKLIPELEKYPELKQKIENYYTSDNKLLPVIITGSSSSLSQSFLVALQRTLNENDLTNVMPDTNFHAAVKVIKRWKGVYPQTYKALIEEIEEPIDLYIEKLESYNIEAYQKFENIYPKLTSGSHFNPFLGFDVVELYEKVAEGLKEYGYKGIFIVFDEFSKYLETNITQASFSDTKMLQDFAEKCNRSLKSQLHIILISHKEIANYIDKLPKQKVDGWRGVSERFLHVHLNNNFSQTYEVIASAIQKEKSIWKLFCNKNINNFENLIFRYKNHPLFNDVDEELFENLFFGCYPLHPVSTFILPRLSERVAQNERTLFTFLSSKGNSTLSSFLAEQNQEDFQLLLPDKIYDYFEPLFIKELHSSEIHQIFVLTKLILEQLEEQSLESQIVKTISLIYMLDQFEKIKPTKEEIIGIFSSKYTFSEIENILNRLIENDLVIYLKKSNGFLRLKQASGIDIRKQINDTIESQKRKYAVKEILNQINFDNYLYPSQYNDEKEMTRYFAFNFIDEDEIFENINWSLKTENMIADGFIFGVIPDNETLPDELKKKVIDSSVGNEQCIFVLPRNIVDIQNVVQEYKAVSTLREQAIGSRILFDEYDVIYDDLQEVINSYISGFTRPENCKSIYIHNGIEKRIFRRSSLSALMSEICLKTFPLTPVISNEALNKNDITSVAEKSRNKVISALLKDPLEKNLGFTGSGQEVSIMRSLLIKKGILKTEEERAFIELNISEKDPELQHVFDAIIETIFETQKYGKITFDLLYKKLKSADYKIGMRSGLIPLYLAVVFHEYKNNVVISDRLGQVPLNLDIFLAIDADPENYFLSFLDWNKEKAEIVKELEKLFERNPEVEADVFHDYNYVSRLMYRWYMALPRYSKEIKISVNNEDIPNEYLKFLRIIKKNYVGSELIFEKIPAVFGQEYVVPEMIDKIKEIKEYYDNSLSALKANLNMEIKNIMGGAGNNQFERVSLYSVVKDWYQKLDQGISEHIFNSGLNRWLVLCAQITNDEELFVEKACFELIGLHIEDWDDKQKKVFLEKIKSYKQEAEDYVSQTKIIDDENNHSNQYKVVFVGTDGKASTRQFERVDYGTRGKLLFNQITDALDAMGESISEQEKRQVLMEVLKDLC